MAIVILGLIGAVVIAVASIAGLLISAEAEISSSENVQGQPKLS